MKKHTKLIAIVMLVAFSLTIFSTMAFAASGSLTMSGSTTVQPLAEKLKAAFCAENPNVSITIAGGGSGVGIKDVAAGKVNIGNASRALNPTDPKGVVAHTVGWDAICVIVNPANSVTVLTKEQVNKVFTGQITNWKDLGGKEAPIVPYIRTAPSGTMDFFHESFMNESSTMVATAKQFESNGLMVAAVAKEPNSIGFCSMGYLNEQIKALTLDGVEATMANALAGTYAYIRPLNMCTMGAADGLAKAFIDFTFSQSGQTIVKTEWIPVNEKPNI